MDKRIGIGPRPVKIVYTATVGGADSNVNACTLAIRGYISESEYNFIKGRPHRVDRSDRRVHEYNVTTGKTAVFDEYSIWLDLTQRECTIVALKFGWLVPS